MHRRWLWVSLLPLALGAGMLATGRQQVAVPIDDLTELRVLKVSLGTNHVLPNEALWKQVARYVLPDSILGAFQGHRHRTSYPALVVWVGHFLELVWVVALSSAT